MPGDKFFILYHRKYRLLDRNNGFDNWALVIPKQEVVMSGLIFYGTGMFEKISRFYSDDLGMYLWLDQGGCRIFKSGNLLLGFCEREVIETSGIITFFFDSRKEIDAIYEKLKDRSENEPQYNPKYNIYHFFARDPEGRRIEFQKFESALPDYHCGSENLVLRRSIRKYSDKKPDKMILKSIFELCRYSPTSMNSQRYYYVVTDDADKIRQLSEVRERASQPLRDAPYAVAVCCSPDTKSVQQDADIAATYLLLAAHSQGLGTCWITDMDRSVVKEILAIAPEDYVTCLTPLGYPGETKDIPQRREIEEFVKYI
jgi:nitroreductase